MDPFGAGKEEDGKEQKVEDKVGPSPWAEATSEVVPPRDVAGWKDGAALTVREVKELMQTERWARQEYRKMQKMIRRKAAEEQSDPLAGLPPTWQAFWSTVPHLNPQAAYRKHQKEQEHLDRAQKRAAAGEPPEDEEADGEPEDQAALEAEVAKLEAEVREKKEHLGEKERAQAQWQQKLNKAREVDAQEAEQSRNVKRKLEAASYKHGILEGKIRSSDIYFQYLMSDAQESHEKKVLTLRRSCALMDQKINALKGEVRLLLKAAAEREDEEASQLAASLRGSEPSRGSEPPASPDARSQTSEQAAQG